MTGAGKEQVGGMTTIEVTAESLEEQAIAAYSSYATEMESLRATVWRSLKSRIALGRVLAAMRDRDGASLTQAWVRRYLPGLPWRDAREFMQLAEAGISEELGLAEARMLMRSLGASRMSIPDLEEKLRRSGKLSRAEIRQLYRLAFGGDCEDWGSGFNVAGAVTRGGKSFQQSFTLASIEDAIAKWESRYRAIANGEIPETPLQPERPTPKPAPMWVTESSDRGIGQKNGGPSGLPSSRYSEEGSGEFPGKEEELEEEGAIATSPVDRIAERKEELRSQLPAMAPFPSGEYSVIVADPPWRYHLRENDLTHRGRIPYPSMNDEEIVGLPVRQLIHGGGSYLLLWTTNAHLPLAFSCLECWGFDYKQIFTWVKVTKSQEFKLKMGLGHNGRNCSEHFLLGSRNASALSTLGLTDICNVLHAPVGAHSEKPEEFWEIADQLMGALPSGSRGIELFSRNPRDGWDAWGLEA